MSIIIIDDNQECLFVANKALLELKKDGLLSCELELKLSDFNGAEKLIKKADPQKDFIIIDLFEGEEPKGLDLLRKGIKKRFKTIQQITRERIKETPIDFESWKKESKDEAFLRKKFEEAKLRRRMVLIEERNQPGKIGIATDGERHQGKLSQLRGDSDGIFSGALIGIEHFMSGSKWKRKPDIFDQNGFDKMSTREWKTVLKKFLSY